MEPQEPLIVKWLDLVTLDDDLADVTLLIYEDDKGTVFTLVIDPDNNE